MRTLQTKKKGNTENGLRTTCTWWRHLVITSSLVVEMSWKYTELCRKQLR